MKNISLSSKQTVMLFVAAGCLFASALSLATGAHMSLPLMAAEVSDTTVTLNASNAPTDSTTVVESIDIAHGYAHFTYKNVVYSSDNHCSLETNGSIEKTDAANELKSITVVFSKYNDSSSLFLQTKADASDDYTTGYPMSSGQTYEISGNYIKLVTNTGVTINSISFTFGCEIPVDSNFVTYRYIDKVNGAWGYHYGSTNKMMANVNSRGTFNMAASDTDSSHWRYKDDRGRNGIVETPTGGLNIAPKCASIGIKEGNGASSRFIFPFSMESNATVQINIRMAKYEGDIGLRTGNLSCWVSLDGQYLLAPNVMFGHTDTNLYYNFKDCDYGTFSLPKGNHVLMLEVFSNVVPTVDVAQLNVTNYGLSPDPLFNIRTNDTFVAEVEHLLGPTFGLKSYDPAWIGIHPSTNNPLEGSSVLSTAGINACSVYKFNIFLVSPADVQLCGYFGTNNAINLTESTILMIDGKPVDKSKFSDVSLPGGTGWTTFYELNMGTYSLSAGYHEIAFTNSVAYNIDKYTLTTSNIIDSLFETNASSKVHLEAEDARIDRSGWSIRTDFVNAGKEPIEAWTNSGATALQTLNGTCVIGLNAGCEITLPFILNEPATFELISYIARSEAQNISENFTILIDDVEINSVDTTTVTGSSSVSTYWNWKAWSSGQVQLDAGLHVVVLRQDTAGFNIDSFDFITTAR